MTALPVALYVLGSFLLQSMPMPLPSVHTSGAWLIRVAHTLHTYGPSTCCCLQRAILDFMALSLGMVCSLRPANERLTPKHPAQLLCSSTNFIMLAATMALSASMYWACMAYMITQDWYTGGTGTPFRNPITTFCWTCALCQVRFAASCYDRSL